MTQLAPIQLNDGTIIYIEAVNSGNSGLLQAFGDAEF